MRAEVANLAGDIRPKIQVEQSMDGNYVRHHSNVSARVGSDSVGGRPAGLRWSGAGHQTAGGKRWNESCSQTFALLSWPAFAVSTFTGIWNALDIPFEDYPNSYKAVFGAKMTCFIITGGGAALHSLLPFKWAKALGGAMASLGAVAVLFFAVALKYANHS